MYFHLLNEKEKPEKNPSASEKAIYKQVFLAESVDDTTIATTSRTPSQTQPLNFLDIWAIDCLNFYPMRKWREFSVRYPLQCWVTTGCIWLTGQLVFATHEFGCVYFILSLFLLMLLNLGVRKEGEASAYSVFNPNCERLLGQMTGEHFERDVLRRRNVNDE
uniref:SAYSvFN domain-containing protein n=1 Tax=Ditylenchus dipsaci TaxID=166011 RepID=A0A915EJX9_9BILA